MFEGHSWNASTFSKKRFFQQLPVLTRMLLETGFTVNRIEKYSTLYAVKVCRSVDIKAKCKFKLKMPVQRRFQQSLP